MSHAYLIVLADKDVFCENGEIDWRTSQKNAENYLERKMTYYSESLQVPEYDRECYCKGQVAVTASYKAADKEVGSLDSFRDRYWALTDDERSKIEWDEFIKPYTSIQEAVFESHPDKDKSDPECSSCAGTGTYKSTYNPNSKWDWYVIGGRWNGVVMRKPENDEKGYNFGDKYHEIRSNLILVDDMLPLEDDDIPFAILTPGGEWNEKGKMGWWGVVTDKKDDWKEAGRKILEAHKGFYAIGVDYHI